MGVFDVAHMRPRAIQQSNGLYVETHPHAILLGRVERIEKTLEISQRKSGAGVLNCYENAFGSRCTDLMTSVAARSV